MGLHGTEPGLKNGNEKRDGGVHALPVDLWGHVVQHLDSDDILSVQRVRANIWFSVGYTHFSVHQTCSILYNVAKQRFIWLALARKVCEQYGLFSASFPLERMSRAELQHLVLSPLKFEKLVTAFNGRSLPPAHI